MMPMIGAKSGTLTTLLSSVTSPKPPVTTPASATPIGSPIASTEPNDTIRTTIANAKPINSDSGGSNSPSAAPPISIRRPSMEGSDSLISLPISADSVWSTSLSRLICANAIVPSAAIWLAPSSE